MLRFRHIAIGATLFAGAAAWRTIQHTTSVQLLEREKAKRQRGEKLALLAAENQKLSNRVSQNEAADRLTDEDFRELLRLRNEVGLLRETMREFDRFRETNNHYLSDLAKSMKVK